MATATFDGQYIFGDAVHVNHVPHPNAQQLGRVLWG